MKSKISRAFLFLPPSPLRKNAVYVEHEGHEDQEERGVEAEVARGAELFCFFFNEEER
jgi:hypothetical protein